MLIRTYSVVCLCIIQAWESIFEFNLLCVCVKDRQSVSMHHLICFKRLFKINSLFVLKSIGAYASFKVL